MYLCKDIRLYRVRLRIERELGRNNVIMNKKMEWTKVSREKYTHFYSKHIMFHHRVYMSLLKGSPCVNKISSLFLSFYRTYFVIPPVSFLHRLESYLNLDLRRVSCGHNDSTVKSWYFEKISNSLFLSFYSSFSFCTGIKIPKDLLFLFYTVLSEYTQIFVL